MYLSADHELTCEARLRAAGLWAGPGAVVSGVAAAWWHGLWADPPAMMEVTVPHGRQLAAQRGLRARRRDLPVEDVVELRGVCVTAVPLTVLDAAVALGQAGPMLLDRALQRRVDLRALYRAHCRNLGRRGSTAAADLLRTAADRAASEAERIMIRLLRVAQLTGWRCGYRIGACEVDIAFPESRVAIEVDGWAWHSDPEKFRHDRQRQNALVLAGWTVLRFTWHDLVNRADAVIAEIRAAVGVCPAA